MRALIVDDSRTMRRILRALLLSVGFTAVEEAEDGEEALARLHGDQPDLVLLDWSMPHMDGLEAVRELRGRGFRSPVIMVSTEASRERVLEAMQAGVNCYVIKPFTPETFVARVRETLGREAA